jgi:hypothetical protein
MEMKMNHPFPKTIEEAAKLLDKVAPEWYTVVDHIKLDMTAHYGCVLGQLFKGYSEGIERLFGLNLEHWQSKYDMIFGDDASRSQWVYEICYRQKNKETSPVQQMNEKPSIQITIPKIIVQKVVLDFIHDEFSLHQVKLEHIEPIMQQQYDNPPEFEGFKATVFVG